MEALGALFILLGFVLFLAAVALWVWTLLDAARTPNEHWESAGQSKPLWLVVLVAAVPLGVAVVGSLLYLLIPRPRLRMARALPPPIS